MTHTAKKPALGPEDEGKYGLIIKSSPDMIFTLNEQGTFLFASPSFEQIMGYEPARMQGRGFREFIHPHDLPLCESYFRDMLENRPARPGLEYRISHAGGGWRWHTVSGAAVRGQDGALLHFIGVARDVTERKEAEQALVSSYNRLEKMAERRTREMKALAREQASEAGRRGLLEAELAATQKHLRETIEHMQALAESERQRARREVYEDLGEAAALLDRELEWLSGQDGSPELAQRAGSLRQALKVLEGSAKAPAAPLEQMRIGLPREQAAKPGPLPHQLLSDNELTVFKHIAGGLPIKQIAQKMGISPSTVSTYRARLMRKLNLSSDAELIRHAIEHGLGR